ncbi:MAG: endolytic transglycosylase MltG [Tissierellia bacterium]|nr:endolytic transglycosylase MltG [Tissierellia bacterium]
MLDKFKLPYFILGLGIGIIITNALYSFNPNIEYKEYTEEEIISSAKELGMVFVKDSINISKEETKPLDETKTASQDEIEKELVLVVEPGDSLEKVSNKLSLLGIVENEQDFHKFAKEKNLEKKIRVGTYKLDQNMDYEILIKILTKSLQ